MFEIVKRQHIRRADYLVPRTSDGPQPFAPDMLGKQNMSSKQFEDRSFLRSLFGLCRADIDHESNQVS